MIRRNHSGSFLFRDFEFRKSAKILALFNNFEDYLCEESLWQISETIKPRGSAKKKVDS